MIAHKLLCAALLAAALQAQQTVEVVAVAASSGERQLQLPGEFLPYQEVTLHAKLAGFVERVEVDRGSVVKEGDVLATLVAPELAAQRAEAEARVHAAEAQRAEAEARQLAAQSTYERLKAASATPGAIAGNELVLAEKSAEAVRAQVRAAASYVQAARASVKAIEDMQAYLRVTAPFAGVITARHVHPGAFSGPGGDKPLFQLEQDNQLRLVVAVPEVDVSGIPLKASLAFTVPAYPGETFHGTVARVARSMDPKTRTMAVELDVSNARGRLAPGMYPTVTWPVRRARPALLVPATAVVTTTERTFVIRIRNGQAEWVTVTKAAASGEQVEIRGPLQAGDEIVKRASDELREGTHVTPRRG
jgi:RND family efflux transporter MFP subunit